MIYTVRAKTKPPKDRTSSGTFQILERRWLIRSGSMVIKAPSGSSLVVLGGIIPKDMIYNSLHY